MQFIVAFCQSIGCNNGYYIFRMVPSEPRFVLGFEPSVQHYYCFKALQAMAGFDNLAVDLDMQMMPARIQAKSGCVTLEDMSFLQGDGLAWRDVGDRPFEGPRGGFAGCFGKIDHGCSFPVDRVDPCRWFRFIFSDFPRSDGDAGYYPEYPPEQLEKGKTYVLRPTRRCAVSRLSTSGSQPALSTLASGL